MKVFFLYQLYLGSYWSTVLSNASKATLSHCPNPTSEKTLSAGFAARRMIQAMSTSQHSVWEWAEQDEGERWRRICELDILFWVWVPCFFVDNEYYKLL